jgi:hypothetical protein
MKKIYFLALLLFLSIVFSSNPSQASIIGSSTTDFWSSVPEGYLGSSPLISFPAKPGFRNLIFGNVYNPFGNIYFSSNAVGKRFLVDSGNEFDNAVSILTNGYDDDLTLSFLTSTGSLNVIGVGLESSKLTGLGFTNPDYKGSVINWMILTIDSYESQQTTNQLGETGYETIFKYTITYGNGPAPVSEPATMLLLGSGLIGLVGYGRKKF